MPELTRISWLDAEPARLAREQVAMPLVAPDLVWTGVGWIGTAPVWPFERAAPTQLDEFLHKRRLHLAVLYPESFPMVPPHFVPTNPEPDLRVRTVHAWHVNGDGSLCLFQNSTDWDPWSTAADLVPKASGWFLEYLLLTDDRIDEMTVNGIVGDDSLDPLFVAQ